MSALTSLPPAINSRIEQMTGDLNTAKIILLGDLHGDSMQPRLRKAVIDALAKPGDYVLYESKQRFVEVHPDSQFETRGRTDLCTLGWDDTETIKEANKIVPFQLSITENIDTLAKENRLTPFTNEVSMAALLYSIRYTDKFDLGIRNEWMLGAIRMLRDNDPKQNIFVIGGLDHFNPAQLEKIQAIAPACSIVFSTALENPEEKRPDHLKVIAQETAPSLLAHLTPLRDAVGPCTLLHPTTRSENLRPPEFAKPKPPVKKSRTQQIALAAAAALTAIACAYTSRI